MRRKLVKKKTFRESLSSFLEHIWGNKTEIVCFVALKWNTEAWAVQGHLLNSRLVVTPFIIPLPRLRLLELLNPRELDSSNLKSQCVIICQMCLCCCVSVTLRRQECTRFSLPAIQLTERFKSQWRALVYSSVVWGNAAFSVRGCSLHVFWSQLMLFRDTWAECVEGGFSSLL